jgi:hypothetical protein
MVTAIVEGFVLDTLEAEIGVELEREPRLDYYGSTIQPDGKGLTKDGPIFVEVFSRLGKFKPGEKRKISTDALKFVMLRNDHPEARLMLALSMTKQPVDRWLARCGA